MNSHRTGSGHALSEILSANSPRGARILSRHAPLAHVIPTYALEVGGVILQDICVDKILDFVSQNDLETFENAAFKREIDEKARLELIVTQSEQENRRDKSAGAAPATVATASDSDESDAPNAPVLGDVAQSAPTIGRHGRPRPTYSHLYKQRRRRGRGGSSAVVSGQGRQDHLVKEIQTRGLAPTIYSATADEHPAKRVRQESGQESSSLVSSDESRSSDRKRGMHPQVMVLITTPGKCKSVEHESQARLFSTSRSSSEEPSADDAEITMRPTVAPRTLHTLHSLSSPGKQLRARSPSTTSSTVSTSSSDASSPRALIPSDTIAFRDSRSAREKPSSDSPRSQSTPRLQRFSSVASAQDAVTVISISSSSVVSTSSSPSPSPVPSPPPDSEPDPPAHSPPDSAPDPPAHSPLDPAPDPDQTSASSPSSTTSDYEIERITAHHLSDPRTHGPDAPSNKPVMLYHVKWRGYATQTWEPLSSFVDRSVVTDYWDRHKAARTDKASASTTSAALRPGGSAKR